MRPHEQLEVEFGRWTGNPNMVACSSGTAALHLALECLQLPPGSEVIVPEFTMVACARAVTLAGLKPVFVDVGDDLLMDTSKLIDALSSDTRAVMPVHIYGRGCNVSEIFYWARDNGLLVVEDCAEYHGGRKHPSGADYADVSCWSFYRNKIVAGEEGGALAFCNGLDDKVDLARSLRSMGFTDQHNFLHVSRGCNYRMSDSHANLILKSLAQADENLVKRRQVETWYDARIPHEWWMPKRDVVWVYDVRVRGIDVDQVVSRLNAAGVAARCGFKPMSQQKEYWNQGYSKTNAYRLSREVFYLPVDPAMTEEDVDRICAATRGVLGK